MANCTSDVLLPISEIIPGENDRTTFNAEELRELANSIADIGLGQPITVRPLPETDLYQVVCGERRFRACQLLGWTEVPVIIREYDDETASSMMLAENLKRKDLSPLETARAFDKRIKQFGWSVQECAEKSNVRPDMVRRRVKLLQLCKEAQFLVDAGNLPLSHAETMADLDNNRQMLALRLFTDKPPTLADFRSYCSKLLEAQTQECMFDATEFTLAAMEANAELTTKTGAGLMLHPRIPKPKIVCGGIGLNLEKYIADLTTAGENDAALVIATLYDGLVRGNYGRVPQNRLVPDTMLASA